MHSRWYSKVTQAEQLPKKSETESTKPTSPVAATSTDESTPARDAKSALKRILALAKPEAKVLSIALVALAVSTATNLIFPAAAGSIVDAISASIATASYSELNKVALGLGGIFVVGGVASFFRYSLMEIAGQRISANLRKRLFSSIIRKDIVFFDRARTGELINRLSTDITVISQTITQNITSGLRYFAQAIGGLAILFYLSPKLALVTLISIPPVAVGAVLYGRYLRRLTKQVMTALSKSTEVAEERISNVRTVRLFSREDAEVARYGAKVDNVFNLARQEALVSASFHGIVGVLANMSMLAVLYYGGSLVISEQITIGTLASFLLYSIYVGFSFSGLSSLYGTLMKAAGAGERVFDILDEPAIVNTPGGQKLKELVGKIEFRDVTFSYPMRSQNAVLQHFTLKLDPGNVIALVGGSGSGKSTVISLLSRMYDPQQGTILIDDTDIRALDGSWLREHIGVVTQEPVLFATSIAENIRYSRLDATQEEIEEAAKRANAHNFILSFPNGYQTEVGERGVALSGGQRQRISIARAILKNPKILILDEATSALDAESEHLVKEALDRLMVGRSCLIIAHRLSTIQNADNIAVLDAGSVTEYGTHSELLTKENGIYRQLVTRQMQWDVDTEDDGAAANTTSTQQA